jgi:hypothetical protein
MSLSSLSSMIVEHYSQHSWRGGEIMTIAAFNQSQITEVTTATTDLANSLMANVTRFGHAILRAASSAEPHSPLPDPYRYSSCRDLYDFAVEIKREISDSSIQQKAQNLISTIENTLIAEWHGPAHPNFHGLYIYLPANEEDYNNRVNFYGKTYSMAHPSWAQNSTWDDLLFQLFHIYAGGLRSQEYFGEYLYTSFDGNNDSYLDALHLELDIYTEGDPISVTAQGFLIDQYGDFVDQFNDTQNINGASGTSDVYLYIPSGGEEGWYDVKVVLYDEYGIFEDELYLQQIAFLPEEMLHEVSFHDISTIKTVVGQGYPAEVEVTIENEGHYSESLNITTYANGTLIDTTQLNLTPQNSTTFTIHWNTTNQNKGNYTITSFVEPVEGEVNTTDNFILSDQEIFITLSGDFDADHDVDIFDIVRIAGIYGTSEEQQQYESNCDIDSDGDIDIFDIVAAATHYGESW